MNWNGPRIDNRGRPSFGVRTGGCLCNWMVDAHSGRKEAAARDRSVCSEVKRPTTLCRIRSTLSTTQNTERRKAKSQLRLSLYVFLVPGRKILCLEMDTSRGASVLLFHDKQQKSCHRQGAMAH